MATPAQGGHGGKYDTMIEKRHNHMDTGDGEDVPWETMNSVAITSSSNGLKRVESEGNTSLAGNTPQSKTTTKGFSFRALSADHVGLGGGSNFSELFDTTQNVQETFV